jgi:hypothetical protein
VNGIRDIHRDIHQFPFNTPPRPSRRLLSKVEMFDRGKGASNYSRRNFRRKNLAIVYQGIHRRRLLSRPVRRRDGNAGASVCETGKRLTCSFEPMKAPLQLSFEQAHCAI